MTEGASLRSKRYHNIMSSPVPNKSDPIVIVGAGIFGLSTAIHLAKRGYEDVHVFDKQPYEQTLYSYLDGCDAASAGMSICPTTDVPLQMLSILSLITFEI
jgi:glycine/D-amino acid oxidase-like deaminating enzyme